MIKFFRKIRHNLLSEGKTVKYLKYAIGEIILVVFGILIALQINNWNSDKKDRKEEIKYLNRLILDLQTDSINYQRGMKRMDLKMEDVNTYLKTVKEGMPVTKELMKLSTRSFFVPPVNSQNTTFEEMKSSGKFDIIQNDKLTKVIFDYYALCKFIKDVETINNNMTFQQTQPYFNQFDFNSYLHMISENVVEVDELNLDFFNDRSTNEFKEFTNGYSAGALMALGSKMSYQKGLENSIKLKNEIQNYLDEK